MKRLFLPLILALFVLNACKSKKDKLADDDTVTIEEFIDFFPSVELPFRVADTSLLKKQTDSSLIGFKIFSQFVPDSVLRKQFGKNVKPKIYPLGKAQVDKNETYLFIKAIAGTKKVASILVFNQEQKFVAAMTLLQPDSDPTTSQFAAMDNKYTITLNRQKRGNEGLIYKKDAYVFNNAGIFMLILTESNDNSATNVNTAVLNPIDTFPKKHKVAGDYIKDKRNFVSVRDGKSPAHILFFIHFEKDNSTCNGELKGEATFKGPNIAYYRQSGDQCVLQLNFKGNTVSLKEDEACGTHRDIKCFFDGTYTKRKEAKAKPVKKKKQ